MIENLRNPQGERLDATLHRAEIDSETLLLIGHGVTGNKDRPFAVALAEASAAAGMSALRFSFAGNGESEGRFVDATISKEVEDLGAVIDAVLDARPGRRVLYAGHSMGGAVGVLRASHDPRIEGLVSLAGMVDTAGFTALKFAEVEPGVGCMWDLPACPLSQAYVDDMNALGSLAELGAQVAVPWILVHGTADSVVPIEDSRQILAAADRGRTELIEIEGADHVFSGASMDRMVAVVVPWLMVQA